MEENSAKLKKTKLKKGLIVKSSINEGIYSSNNRSNIRYCSKALTCFDTGTPLQRVTFTRPMSRTWFSDLYLYPVSPMVPYRTVCIENQCCGSASFWASRTRYLYGFGSGSYHHQPKKVPTGKKTLISTVLWLIFNILSQKTDVNYLQKVPVISKKL